MRQPDEHLEPATQVLIKYVTLREAPQNRLCVLEPGVKGGVGGREESPTVTNPHQRLPVLVRTRRCSGTRLPSRISRSSGKRW